MSRKYAFTYNSTTTLLESIKLFDGYDELAMQQNGWSLKGKENFENPLFLNGYGYSAAGGAWTVGDNPRHMADVNGDGMADIVGFTDTNIIVSLANGTSFDSPREWLKDSLTKKTSWSSANLRMLIDLNGDGLADILGFSYHGVVAALSNGIDKFIYDTIFKYDGIFSNHVYGDINNKYSRHVGDINGDGLPDLIGFPHEGVEYAMNLGNRFYSYFANGLFSSTSGWNKDDNRFFVADMNGDGMDDLVAIKGANQISGIKSWSKATEVHVCLSDGKGFQERVRWLTFSESHVLCAKTDPDKLPVQIEFADVNGDGKKDLIIFSASGTKVHLSTGSGLQAAVHWSNNFGGVGGWLAEYNQKYPRMVLDINNDGLADVIMFAQSNVILGLSTKKNFREVIIPMSTYSFGDGWNYTRHIRTLADINGDGIPDIIGFKDNGVYISKGNANEQQYLTTIANEGKEKVKLTYAKLSNDPVVYKKNHGSIYPSPNYNGPLVVVKNLAQIDGIGGYNTTNYSYEGAKIHIYGKGFLGFSKTAQWNTTLNTLDSLQYEILPQSLHVLPKRKVSYLYSNRIKLNESNYFYTERLLSQNRYIFDSVKNIYTDYVMGKGSTTSALWFDIYGNPIEKTINYNSIATVREKYTYTTSASGGNIPYLIQTVKQSSRYLGSPDSLSYYNMYRYNAKGLLEQNYQYDSTFTSVLKNNYYTYNTLGLLTGIYTREGSFTGGNMYTKYEYDIRGRFCTKQYDMLGGQSYTFDPTSGKQLSVTGINNQLTETYTYYKDNLSQVRSPLGLNTLIDKYYIASRSHADAPANTLYYVVTKTAQQADVTVFYDLLDRPLRTVTQNLSGIVFSDIQYNAKGQKVKESEPYFKGETPLWNTYDYDMYGRIYEIKSPTGRSSLFSYMGKTTQVIYPDGSYKNSTVNEIGDVLKVIDGGGTITYTYKAPGLISEINVAGAITKICYDAYGRQIKLVDPDANTITYEYDLWGNIVKQTDARGKIQTTSFDDYGRVIATNDGDYLLNYIYLSNGINKGKVEKITKNNGTAKEYTYDNYGRVVSSTDVINGKRMSTVYGYDAYGRKNKHTYPSGYTLDYIYDNMSHITQIHYQGGQVWKAGGVNALGQEVYSYCGPTSYQMAHQMDYDGNHLPIWKKLMPSGWSNTPLSGQSYVWDNTTANLSNRKDLYYNITENFTYDALQRLKTSANHTMNYTPNGNIVSRTEPGAYTYGSSKPHAVTGVSSTLSSETRDITYNSTGKVLSITQGNSSATFVYGVDNQRIKMEKSINGTITTKYYSEYYEETNGVHYDYIYTPGGLTAIAKNGSVNYVMTDHLGSITVVISPSGSVSQRLHYDAWGRRKYPGSLGLYSLPSAPIFDRGFTGHEHLDEFQLINMNGRLYDPLLGRFLSPDKYVQAPDNTQSYNRYSYCINNPLKYTDPDGDLFGISFTNFGYELDKYLLPFAFKIDFHYTKGRIGFGYDFSYGIPKMFPVSYRKHHGYSHFSKYYDNAFQGTETRDGGEWTFGTAFNFSGTTFKVSGSEDFNQTTNKIRLGWPGASVSYENDYMFGLSMPGVPKADNGDRWRTAAAEIEFGFVKIGVNMMTGDPGLKFKDQVEENGVYIEQNGYNPDKYRLGLFYVKVGPLTIGRNSEQIRHIFQNKFAHDFIMGGKPAWFKKDETREPEWQFGLDTGSGGTLW